MKEKISIFRRVLNALLDVLFTLVLALTVLSAGTVLLNQGQMRFGALGIVRSESMRSYGLEVGDVVYATSKNDYEVGDVIVFYRAPEKYCDFADREELRPYPMWVHQIVEIGVDEKGRTTYLTKGTDNQMDDYYFVPQDFVLGEAQELPAVFAKAIRFVSSVSGIILTVIMPCGIMLVYLTWDLIMLILTEPIDDSRKIRKRWKEMHTESGYRLTFLARLFRADKLTRARYERIKNALLAYNGVKTQIRFESDYFEVNKKPFVNLDIRGKSIFVKFFEENKFEENQWDGFLCVESDRDLQYVLKRIERRAKRLELCKGKSIYVRYSLVPKLTEKDMLRMKIIY